jgi:hypothetical protein
VQAAEFCTIAERSDGVARGRQATMAASSVAPYAAVVVWKIPAARLRATHRGELLALLIAMLAGLLHQSSGQRNLIQGNIVCNDGSSSAAAARL